jgi:hypothetical protein
MHRCQRSFSRVGGQGYTPANRSDERPTSCAGGCSTSESTASKARAGREPPIDRKKAHRFWRWAASILAILHGALCYLVGRRPEIAGCGEHGARTIGGCNPIIVPRLRSQVWQDHGVRCALSAIGRREVQQARGGSVGDRTRRENACRPGNGCRRCGDVCHRTACNRQGRRGGIGNAQG